jgi:MarR family transcriptional regulator, transcriptional regulator for hemolysin
MRGVADGKIERTTRDLTLMFNRAGHALTSQLSAALADVGLNQRMQCVLIHALEEPRTQAELAALADLDKTTMVETTDALERAGYARRVPSPTDRRARIIAVTPAGRKAAVEGQRIVDRVHSAALDQLSAREQAVFLDALTRLESAVAAAPPPAGGPRPVRRRRQATP